jgi:hypothetical protein
MVCPTVCPLLPAIILPLRPRGAYASTPLVAALILSGGILLSKSANRDLTITRQAGSPRTTSSMSPARDARCRALDWRSFLDTLLILVVLFFLFGWTLPPWAWGVVPVVLGIVIFFAAMASISASFRNPSPTSGLGGVLGAFFGIVVFIVGFGMAGQADSTDSIIGWIGLVPIHVWFCIGLGVAMVAHALRR